MYSDYDKKDPKNIVLLPCFDILLNHSFVVLIVEGADDHAFWQGRDI
jgi:hypothetical protein